MSRSGRVEARSVRRGRQSLKNHSSSARTAIDERRCPTRLHTPHPASAIVTASTPLASDATKVIFDSSAKRNCRMKIVFWIVPSALTGTRRKSTGAIRARIGRP